MIKVGLFAIGAIFLAMIFKREKPEFAMLIIFCCSLVIFGFVCREMSIVVSFIRQLMEHLPIDSTYVALLFKLLGIAYLTDFSSSICREAGYSSIAGQIETFAKILILALGIPGMMYLMNTLESFI